MTPQVGDVINGKYELLKELGSGSMGVVFLAIHQLLRSRVAIKFINSELVQNKEARRRFLLEAQIGAEIKHPGVVSVFDIESNGHIYIIMEYLEGKGLDKLINEAGCIVTIEFALDVTIQVLRALHEVHEKGIIHRDLKPENIFVTSRGEAKILDFGIAKARSAALATTHELTSVGTTQGTPHYMSPEQAIGSKTIDHRTDLWSIGVILYEMLTGCLPFIGNTPTNIINRILDGGTNLPRALNPVISERLERAILRAMEPEMKNRYQSAEEMLDDLLVIQAEYEASDEAEEHPVPPGKETRAWIDTAYPKKRRWRLPVAIATAVVLILGGLTGWFFSSHSSTEPPTEPQQAVTPTRTKVEPAPIAQAQAEPEPPAPPEKATPPPPPEPQESVEATAPAKRPPPRPAVKQAIQPEPRRRGMKMLPRQLGREPAPPRPPGMAFLERRPKK